MSTDQPDLLPVIQADIDAAVDLKYALDDAGSTSWSARSEDPAKHPVAQAFARHRLTSTTPTLGDMVRKAAQTLVDRFPSDMPDYSPAYDEVTALRRALSAAPASPMPTSVANEGEREHGLGWRLERIIEDGGPLTLSDKAILREAIAALSPALDNTAVEGRPDDETLDPHLPDSVKSERRCGIQRSDWMTGWFVPWSPRNDNQNAEGPWSHWVALARSILAADDKAHAALSAVQTEKA